MVMVAKSTILIPKGVYVKFQGSEIRVADGIHQGRHATEFVGVTNPGLTSHAKLWKYQTNIFAKLGNGPVGDTEDNANGHLVAELRNGGHTETGAVGNSQHLINGTCVKDGSFVNTTLTKRDKV